MEKNRDQLREDLRDLITSSSMQFVGSLMLPEAASGSVTRAAGGQRRKPTVAAIFAESLAALIDTMSKCYPYFVRCIKPNEQKKASLFEHKLVLDQLRYSGMLETINIRRKGFPVRLAYPAFIFRYRVILKGQLPKKQDDRSLAGAILSRTPKVTEDGWQLGKTRVFLREAVELLLEEARAEGLFDVVVILQKHARRWLAVRRYQRIRRATVVLQSYARMRKAQRDFARRMTAVLRLQAFARMIRPRRQYILIRDERRRQRAAEKEAMRAAGLRTVADVSQLKVLEDLQRLMVNAHDESVQQTARFPANEKLIVQVQETLADAGYSLPSIGSEVAGHDFSKFVTGFFQQGSAWSFAKGELNQSKLRFKNREDEAEALLVFNAIQRYMGDERVHGPMEQVIANYIVQRCIYNEELRDEVLCQLCNQTWCNPNDLNAERGWQLMALCLSCFPPSERLYPYLLCYISQHGFEVRFGV